MTLYPELIPQTCTRPAPHVCAVNGPCNGYPKEGVQLEAAVLAESASVQAEITRNVEELGNYQNWCHENIHVYEVYEDTWVVAESPDAAVLFAINECGAEDELLDEFGPPVELSKEVMARRSFRDEENPEIKTFLDAFNDLLYRGQDFPVLFASII